MGSLNEGRGGKLGRLKKEKEWMKEGVWLKEEESFEMVESLMKTGAYLKEDIANVKSTMTPPQFFGNTNAVMSVKVIKEKDNNNGTEFENLPGLDEKWWEANSMGSGGNDKWPYYDWTFEDDMNIMWNGFGIHTPPLTFLGTLSCGISATSKELQMPSKSL